ncbi:MAG: cytochrome c [Chloroflexi bacterium]|nr:cytochrome c [Chloroflexota bacterium]
MVGNIIALAILVAVVVLFAMLTRRAWRSKRRALKWIGVVLSGLLTVLLGLISVFALIGLFKIYSPRTTPIPNVKISATTDTIAHGKHLADVACAGCHSANDSLPLTGSTRSLSEDFGIDIGTVYAPNLTPASRIKSWSDGELVRAIRVGIDPKGNILAVMTSNHFNEFSDDDLNAIVAYLRNSDAIVRDVPTENLNLLAAIFTGAGLFPDPPLLADKPISAPEKSPHAEYGKYLVTIGGCEDCHGKGFGGSEGGLSPPGPNLTVIVPKWTRDDFLKTIRSGVDPTGHALDPKQMPWKSFAKFDDTELGAIFEFIKTLPVVVKSAK